jgi:hypothetical protein
VRVPELPLVSRLRERVCRALRGVPICPRLFQLPSIFYPLRVESRKGRRGRGSGREAEAEAEAPHPRVVDPTGPRVSGILGLHGEHTRKQRGGECSVGAWAERPLRRDGKVANREIRVRHGATENGPLMMDESKTLNRDCRSCRYITLRLGVLDLSVIQ